MNARRDVERELARLRLPQPSSDLARRVLGAAAERLGATPPPTRLERAWASRPLRWAWAGSLALTLLLGATSERRLERRLEETFARPVSQRPSAPRPEALGLDASWTARLEWAARAAQESDSSRGVSP